jgi:hypothetical protein
MTARQLGGALGVAGLVALLTSNPSGGVDLFSEALIMGGVAVALIVPFFLLPPRHTRSAPESSRAARGHDITVGAGAPADVGT